MTIADSAPLLVPRRLYPLHLLFFVLVLFILLLSLADFLSPSSDLLGFQLPIATHAGPPVGSAECVLEIPFDPNFDLPVVLSQFEARCDARDKRIGEMNSALSDYWQFMGLHHLGYPPSYSYDWDSTLTLRIDARVQARLLAEALNGASHHRFAYFQVACRKNPRAPAEFFVLNVFASEDFWHGEVLFAQVIITGQNPPYRVSHRVTDVTYEPGATPTREYPPVSCDLPALRALFKDFSARQKHCIVVLDPADSVTVQQLIDVWDAALSANIEAVTLATPK